MAKARERIEGQRRDDARGTVEGVNKGISSVDEITADYARQNQITAAEKAGDKFGAELMRIADRINAALGSKLYSTTDVAQIMGGDIEARLAMNGTDKIAESLQTSPELTDRLRRIGGGGGEYPNQTQLVFKDSLSVERQQLAVLNQIKEQKGGALTLR